MEVGTGCYFSFDSNVLFSYKTTLALNVILSAWWSRSGSWLGLGALFSLGGGLTMDETMGPNSWIFYKISE